MNDDNLSDYWHAVAPILKQQALEKRESCFNDRLEYARCLVNNCHLLVNMLLF